ncbi:hypothetical protein OAK11_00590 [Candidatus Pelagibacter sp.]|nr:hypothetical protein [Candidatus Pelagibacter sp.]
MSDLFSSININSSFQRSARIDNKISSEFLDHFVFHDTSKKVLNQISSSLLNSNQSGFTLTGPYGTGKSSLALFLKALISKENAIKKQAESIAKFNNKHLFSRVFLNKKSWFTLNVIGSKDDPIDSIAEQIDQTVKENWISKGIPSSLKTKTKKTVAGVIKSLNNLVSELNKKNHGLILIVDEMGKFLDYASSVGSDLNLFQEIAENFSNNRLNKEGEPVFIGILHQPFEEYASSLGRTVQEDWQKIQGRFEDIPFSINSEETAHLIAKAIKQKKTGPEFIKLANSIIKTISGKPNKSYADVLSKCNPIHPLVTLLLNPISRQRFGQNERSIFSFLNSGEPNGFLYFLQNSDDKNEIYTLDKLFDYLQVNLEPSIIVSNIGQAWSEAADSIRRAESLDDKEVIKVAKCISLIDLFGKNISLFPSKEILSNCLDISQNKLTKILKDLESKKIIVFRKFKNAYALFSGSDIDLDKLTELNKSKIKDDYDIILSQLPQLQPIVAKKHFHETGTQRIYQRFCLVLTNIKKAVEEIVRLDISPASAGAFIFLCKTKEDTQKDFEDKLKELSQIPFPKPVIIGTSKNFNEFFNYALEIAALKRVKSTVDAIEGDAIAKKELNGRLTAYQNLLFNSLYLNFENADWTFNKNKVKENNLSSIASLISNEVFKLTPIIHNELVVRDRLSSMSMSGASNLLNRVFNNSDLKNLGMEGNPSEFGIYLSLIKSNNLHIKKGDEFVISIENTNNKSIKTIYDEFLKLIKGSKEAVNVSDIYAHFVKQPYGIKIGLLPILIGIFFKATEASCAFYNKDEQGRESLITEFDQKIAERLYHMPETLKIMFVKIEGEKQIILDEFKSYVEKNFLNNKPIENPTPLYVLKPVVVKAYKLPSYSRKTRNFKDQRVLVLRDELLSTQNPYELLYKKIPEICGTDEPKKLIEEFDKVYSELNKAYDRLIDEFKTKIIKIFKSDSHISDIDFETIKAWAKKIGKQDPFSAKIDELDENKWLEQVISYAASKPANEWNDKDYQEASLKIEEMVRHFIVSYRIYTLREDHSDTKIIDIAIFDGKNPERSSKFYEFKNDQSKSVEKISQDVLKLLEGQNLSESEKGEVVLKVLRKIMKFSNSKDEKLA